MRVSGVRSSCAASATNRRWVSAAASSRSSIRFIVAASRPISSARLGTWIRCPESAALMASTSARMVSTGCRARPVSHHTRTARSATTAGTTRTSVPVSPATASLRSSTFSATCTMPGPAGVSMRRLSTRKASSSSGRSFRVSIAWVRPAARSIGSAAVPARLALATSTVPSGPITCTARSSSSAGRSAPAGASSSSAVTESARCSSEASSRVVSWRCCTAITAPAVPVSTTATTAVASAVRRNRSDPVRPVPGMASALNRRRRRDDNRRRARSRWCVGRTECRCGSGVDGCRPPRCWGHRRSRSPRHR